MVRCIAADRGETTIGGYGFVRPGSFDSGAFCLFDDGHPLGSKRELLMGSELLFEWMSDPAAWAGLATLVALEIVLGIDNLVFIAILADKLPEHQRDRGPMSFW